MGIRAPSAGSTGKASKCGDTPVLAKGGGGVNKDCIFCKIVAGELPARIVHEDELAIAFHDIQPQAPVHVLIIPRRHLPAISEMEPADRDMVGHLHWLARELAVTLGIAETGYRLVINNGRDANQTVGHLHLHLLGGRSMGWPPG